jgi:hypothetical protein
MKLRNLFWGLVALVVIVAAVAAGSHLSGSDNEALRAEIQALKAARPAEALPPPPATVVPTAPFNPAAPVATPAPSTFMFAPAPPEQRTMMWSKITSEAEATASADGGIIAFRSARYSNTQPGDVLSAEEEAIRAELVRVASSYPEIVNIVATRQKTTLDKYRLFVLPSRHDSRVFNYVLRSPNLASIYDTADPEAVKAARLRNDGRPLTSVGGMPRDGTGLSRAGSLPAKTSLGAIYCPGCNAPATGIPKGASATCVACGTRIRNG